MVLVHVFEYIGNLFEEVSGHVGELLTLDVKEKINDDVEQKTGNILKKCQRQYYIFINKKFVGKSYSMIPSNKNERCLTQGSLAEVFRRLALIGSQYGVHFIKIERQDEISPCGCKKI